MSEDYIDKLVDDIQEYLREEEERSLTAQEPTPRHISEPAATRRSGRPSLIGLMTLMSASAVGSITIAILLLGIIGVPSGNPVEIIWLFAAGGCGIFFSTMLVSAWKRLILLGKIEKNTRLILESKQAANALLEQYINKVI